MKLALVPERRPRLSYAGHTPASVPTPGGSRPEPRRFPWPSKHAQVLCASASWLQLQCPAMAGRRLVQLPLFLQRGAQVVLGLGIVRLQLHCSAITGDRFVQLSPLAQGNTQVAVGHGEVGCNSTPGGEVTSFVQFPLDLEGIAARSLWTSARFGVSSSARRQEATASSSLPCSAERDPSCCRPRRSSASVSRPGGKRPPPPSASPALKHKAQVAVGLGKSGFSCTRRRSEATAASGFSAGAADAPPGCSGSRLSGVQPDRPPDVLDGYLVPARVVRKQRPAGATPRVAPGRRPESAGRSARPRPVGQPDGARGQAPGLRRWWPRGRGWGLNGKC